MMGLKKVWLGGAIAAMVATGCVLVIDPDMRLTIHNHSSRVITEVRLGNAGPPWWGRNLLPGDLSPGDDVVVDRAECGYYDVLVVDAQGRSCVTDTIYLCFNDFDWVLDDAMMGRCGFAP